MSHDIRQPLQAVALQVGSLNSEVTAPEGKRKLRAIERSLSSGMELLDFLLDYIKLDAGALKPLPTTVTIGNLFEMLSDLFALMATQKGISLTLVPTQLATHSDPQMLGRTLRNLVSNAVKYTDRGRILIGCRRQANTGSETKSGTRAAAFAPNTNGRFCGSRAEIKEPGGPNTGLDWARDRRQAG